MKKKIIPYIVSVVLILSLSFGYSNAWNGLFASVWDVLNTTKWNEMITELNTKINQSDVIAWPGISVTPTGSWVTISNASSAGISPFLSSDSLTLARNSSYTITLEWEYFTPNTNLSIPWLVWTVNNVSVLTPRSMDVDVTIWNSVWIFDFILSNWSSDNTIWPGNWEDHLTVIPPVAGTWPAWTYNEGFQAWLWSWSATGWQEPWTRDSGGTPSTGTGPNSGAGSTFYVYTETTWAGTWYPNRTFILQTSNFSTAQSISFDYHAFGATIWILELQTLHNWVWTTRDTISWQQQTNQGDAYINRTIDLSLFPVESIRFFYTSGTNFTWDIALDNISIISN